MSDLHLLHCPLTPLPKHIEAQWVETHLDDKEKQRYQASNIANSRLQLVLSRWLVKQYMHELTGLPLPQFHFHYTEYGKPFLRSLDDTQTAMQFSLAHCNTSVAVALCHTPVGVDVENRRRNGKPWEIIGDIFNCTVADRMAELDSLDAQKAFFFKHWTAMESMVKMKGSKVALERKHFARDFALGSSASYVDAQDKHFYFIDITSDELVAVTSNAPITNATVTNFNITAEGVIKTQLDIPNGWLENSLSNR